MATQTTATQADIIRNQVLLDLEKQRAAAAAQQANAVLWAIPFRLAAEWYFYDKNKNRYNYYRPTYGYGYGYGPYYHPYHPGAFVAETIILFGCATTLAGVSFMNAYFPATSQAISDAAAISSNFVYTTGSNIVTTVTPYVVSANVYFKDYIATPLDKAVSGTASVVKDSLNACYENPVLGVAALCFAYGTYKLCNSMSATENAVEADVDANVDANVDESVDSIFDTEESIKAVPKLKKQ